MPWLILYADVSVGASDSPNPLAIHPKDTDALEYQGVLYSEAQIIDVEMHNAWAACREASQDCKSCKKDLVAHLRSGTMTL